MDEQHHLPCPGQGWLYLCVIRHGPSRRVFGHGFPDSLHTDIVGTALRRGITFRDGGTTGVILPADRACQYTSTQLAVAAQALGVLLSVGRTCVCWDDARIESLWSTLTTEFYDRHESPSSRTEVIHTVSSEIENVYTRRRRHSALRKIPQVTFEHPIITAASKAAQPRFIRLGQTHPRRRCIRCIWVPDRRAAKSGLRTS